MSVTTRDLEESPSLGSLYAKAVAPSVPGLGRLLLRATATGESVAGGHRSGEVSRDPALPEVELRLSGVGIDVEHLTRYSEVCGFGPRPGRVPATYPHVLVFPLHLEAMTSPGFPFPVMGLVHIGNRIEQRRPLDPDEVVDLRVWAERLRPHPRGTALTLVSEAAVASEVVWRDETVLLRRGAARDAGVGPAQPGGLPEDAPTGPVTWRLDRGLGRRYAAVSGDRNPIHLSALTAKAFGFPRAIAHGMWTKARALAALEPRVPDAFAVEVAFRKPVLLPGEVRLGARQTGQMIDFGVTSGSDRTHLVGRITPLPG